MAEAGAGKFGRLKIIHRRTETTSLDLVSQAVNDFRLGADEEQAGGFDLLGELGVLGEESVSGVDHGHTVLERNLVHHV